jgi:hypothetical protein
MSDDILKAIASATTEAEFNRLEPGFSRAYRRLYDRARKNKLADKQADATIRGLIELVEGNPLFYDQARYPGPYAIGQRILRLSKLLFYFSKEWLSRHPVDGSHRQV